MFGIYFIADFRDPSVLSLTTWRKHEFLRHDPMSAFLLAIYVPLSQDMVMLTQWVTMAPPEIYDTTTVGLSDTFGVH